MYLINHLYIILQNSCNGVHMRSERQSESKREEKPVKFDKLPDVITASYKSSILQFLDYRTLARLTTTSKYFRTLSSEINQRIFKVLTEFALHEDLPNLRLCKNNPIFFPTTEQILQITQAIQISIPERIKLITKILHEPLASYLKMSLSDQSDKIAPASLCLLARNISALPFDKTLLEKLKHLKNKLDRDLFNFLCSDASKKSEAASTVKEYLDLGANPNYIHLLLTGFQCSMEIATKISCADVIKQLIAAGGNVNYYGYSLDSLFERKKMSVLMHAADRPHLQITKLLVAAGADIEKHSPSGKTALWYALRNEISGEDVAVFLIQSGANLRDLSYYFTALHMAASYGLTKVVDYILKYHQHDCPIDETNPLDDGKTPLLSAIENGHVEVVEQLLAAGADPSLCDCEGLDAIATVEAARETKAAELAHNCEEDELEEDLAALHVTYDQIAELISKHQSTFSLHHR